MADPAVMMTASFPTTPAVLVGTGVMVTMSQPYVSPFSWTCPAGLKGRVVLVVVVDPVVIVDVVEEVEVSVRVVVVCVVVVDVEVVVVEEVVVVGALLTVVGSLAVLLAGLTSPPPETMAVLVKVPAAVARTTTWTWGRLPPGGKLRGPEASRG